MLCSDLIWFLLRNRCFSLVKWCNEWIFLSFIWVMDRYLRLYRGNRLDRLVRGVFILELNVVGLVRCRVFILMRSIINGLLVGVVNVGLVLKIVLL